MKMTQRKHVTRRRFAVGFLINFSGNFFLSDTFICIPFIDCCFTDMVTVDVAHWPERPSSLLCHVRFIAWLWLHLLLMP